MTGDNLEYSGAKHRWSDILSSFGFWRALFLIITGIALTVLGVVALLKTRELEMIWAPLLFLCVAIVGVWELSVYLPLRWHTKRPDPKKLSPEDFSGVRVLRASIWKWLLIGCISVTFTFSGKLMLAERPVMGWLIILFFGAGACVSLLQVTIARGRLTLSEEGFEVSNLHKKYFDRWEDVSPFDVLNIPGGPFVSYDRREDQGKMLADINRNLMGVSGMLPDSYGMNAVELATLMNAYRLNRITDKLGI